MHLPQKFTQLVLMTPLLLSDIDVPLMKLFFPPQFGCLLAVPGLSFSYFITLQAINSSLQNPRSAYELKSISAAGV